jgi:lipoprotein-anchoring transpeptidase ErfK/SrfK
MRLRHLLAVALLLAIAPTLGAPAAASVLVSVDKATQRMTVSVDGKPRYTWPVSTGMSGHATPAGSFRAFRMEEEHFSQEWDDAPMPHSIFFTSAGHAIHGSLATKRLGTPASHGCVRIAPANAAKLFALVRAEGLTSTKVVVSGVEPTRAVKRTRAPVRPVRYRAPVEEDGTVDASPQYEAFGSGGPGYGRFR